jgi:hypothetical protein
MSTNTPVVVSRTQPVPPEEQFWKHYSPHHEFPLSSVSSVALHILAFVLLALVAWWVATMTNERDRPLREVGVVLEGGGGGNEKGQGNAPGGQLGGGQEEEKGDQPKEDVNTIQANPKNVIEQPTQVPVPAAVDTSDPSKKQLLDQTNDAMRSLQKIGRDNLKKLARNIGEGKGGPGKDGGKDRGTDSGTGRAKGTGQDLDVRVKRTMRWIMVFNTYDGEDYARQLAGLGATLAFPIPKTSKYMAVNDLNLRPAKGPTRSIEEIQGNRIYWADDKRESITPLCMALGIRPVPDHVVAFFPQKLEEKLLDIELKYKGLREDQIYETRFAIRKSARGYEPEVIEQKENPPQ